MSYLVSEEQRQGFANDGFLVLRDVLSPTEVEDLRLWAQEVHDWPINDNVPYMPYEVGFSLESSRPPCQLLTRTQEVNAHGKRVLCRTENYADYHQGLNSLLRGDTLLGVLQQLSGEPMRLFKEKINYKLAGSGR
jgi:2-aminoethylphosphonate dioxygenase